MIRHGDIIIDRKQRTIACLGYPPLRLGRLKFELVSHLVLAGPQTREQLCQRLWGNREDGGPVEWHRAVSVMICQMRPDLAAVGIIIRNHGRYTPWCSFWAAPQVDRPVMPMRRAA